MIFFVSILLFLFCKGIDRIGKDSISEWLWTVYTSLAPSAACRELRSVQKAAANVYTERSNTSAKDEFARWAKLDREYGKLRTSIDSLQSQLATSKTSFKSVIKLFLFAATSGSLLVLRVLYRKTPVFWLPNGLFPYYVYWVLSFSSAPIGSVSISWWLFVLGSVYSTVTKIAVYVKPGGLKV